VAGSKLVKGNFFPPIQHVVSARISSLQEVVIEDQKAARKADGRKKKSSNNYYIQHHHIWFRKSLSCKLLEAG